MAQTSRELVTRCLRNADPERIPRDLWTLPWAETRYPRELEELRKRFPNDIGYAPDVHRPAPRATGDRYAVGTATDEWGCEFTGVQEGVVGEVKTPLIKNLSEWRSFRPPYEILPDNPSEAREKVNRDCGETDKFILSGCFARPWERLQFLRGTENAMVDIMAAAEDLHGLIGMMQDFFLREAEFWASTAVDALYFMDDWGAQSQLLIPPAIWRDVFKPLYRAYCDIAHAEDKYVFFHSDGFIQEIYPDLIEIGVSAVNSQLFCMDMGYLRDHAKGRITFWGEIDRQHVLPAADPEIGREAVQKVARYLYDPTGGIMAQFELGAGANPGTAFAVFEEWDRVSLTANAAPFQKECL